MNKPRPNLSAHLKTTKRKRKYKLMLLSSIGILSIGIVFYGLFLLPWHGQLFLRWLVRGGDVTSIPERLYPELNVLCYSADRFGKVDGYNGSREIALALGKFNCQRSSDRRYWIVHDIYRFNTPREAGAGSLLAVVLVSLVGTNYSYQIEGIIPTIPYLNGGRGLPLNFSIKNTHQN